MGKHYCRKGGAPVGYSDVPGYTVPGSVVENLDRLEGEARSYGRVRALMLCCSMVLVEFMTDESDDECTDTYTCALALDRVGRIPDGVSYSVPCVGAQWSAFLVCGHVNGEGCDCDTIAAEADGQDDGPCVCTPGVGLGCDDDACVIKSEPRHVSPYGAETLGFSLD